MRRYLGKACAGVLVLAAAGCALDSFLGRQVVVYGPQTIVPGTVAEVSAKLWDGLKEAVEAPLHTKQVGADYRIASQWKSGIAFCLHLQQMQDAGVFKTRVRMQWDRGGDEELWQLILKILNAPAGEDERDEPEAQETDDKPERQR